MQISQIGERSEVRTQRLVASVSWDMRHTKRLEKSIHKTRSDLESPKCCHHDHKVAWLLITAMARVTTLPSQIFITLISFHSCLQNTHEILGRSLPIYALSL